MTMQEAEPGPDHQYNITSKEAVAMTPIYTERLTYACQLKTGANVPLKLIPLVDHAIGESASMLRAMGSGDTVVTILSKYKI